MPPRVPPELLAEAQQTLTNIMTEAHTVAMNTLNNHEDVLAAGSFSGDAAIKSQLTAERINHGLRDVIAGGQQMAHAMGTTLSSWDQQVLDAGHSFDSVLGNIAHPG
jgi:DNA-binding NarL/FixJ family response regulator